MYIVTWNKKRDYELFLCLFIRKKNTLCTILHPNMLSLKRILDILRVWNWFYMGAESRGETDHVLSLIKVLRLSIISIFLKHIFFFIQKDIFIDKNRKREHIVALHGINTSFPRVRNFKWENCDQSCINLLTVFLKIRKSQMKPLTVRVQSDGKILKISDPLLRVSYLSVFGDISKVFL